MNQKEVLKAYVTPLVTCIWEQGGKGRFNSFAVIVGDKQGRIVKPHYMPSEFSIYNGWHALFSVEKGSIIGIARNANSSTLETLEMGIYKVERINKETKKVTCRLIVDYSNGNWNDIKKVEKYCDFADKLFKKVNTSQCTESVYCLREI